LWYATIDDRDVLDVLSSRAAKNARKIIAKARHRTHLQVLEKMSALVDDKLRIVEEAPLIVREAKTHAGRPIIQAIDSRCRSYLNSLALDRRQLLLRYQIVDVARKVVGVGSVGTRCWVTLFKGADNDDPLFLQLKEAQPSVLAPYVRSVNSYPNEGQRVV